ncbi:hypothetical protein QAD02_016426 [Eretmocerus hayati]|uniref:Uncharacterized protein n=1 Tax=Eretmocerus hayati TaxID=131215 RepID=A0ACC2PBG4_9HYME|nr:hypothetical protein QAD02_016426 [Eretmocerus hayati]
MEIKELSSLKRHIGTANTSNPSTSSKEQQADIGSTAGPSTSISSSCVTDESKCTNPCNTGVEPTFGGSRCKLFELSECGDDCRVFLVYQLQPDRDEPSVWLYNSSEDRWYQLADSFVKYFRMMLVHLGLPLWQKCAAGLPLPTWIEQVYLLVGPHLLTSMAPTAAGAAVKQTVSAETSLWSDGPTNLIDPAIFRGKAHSLQHAGVRPKTIATHNTTSSAIASATSTTTSTLAGSNAKKKISH